MSQPSFGSARPILVVRVIDVESSAQLDAAFDGALGVVLDRVRFVGDLAHQLFQDVF